MDNEQKIESNGCTTTTATTTTPTTNDGGNSNLNNGNSDANFDLMDKNLNNLKQQIKDTLQKNSNTDKICLNEVEQENKQQLNDKTKENVNTLITDIKNNNNNNNEEIKKDLLNNDKINIKLNDSPNLIKTNTVQSTQQQNQQQLRTNNRRVVISQEQHQSHCQMTTQSSNSSTTNSTLNIAQTSTINSHKTDTSLPVAHKSLPGANHVLNNCNSDVNKIIKIATKSSVPQLQKISTQVQDIQIVKTLPSLVANTVTTSKVIASTTSTTGQTVTTTTNSYQLSSNLLTNKTKSSINENKSKKGRKQEKLKLNQNKKDNSSSDQTPTKDKKRKIKEKLNEIDQPRLSKRIRSQYQPFQATETLSSSFFKQSTNDDVIKTSTPNTSISSRKVVTNGEPKASTSKAVIEEPPAIPSTSNSLTDDRIVIFNRGDFLAVRNEMNTFYICRSSQNIYKTTKKLRIQWLNDDKKKDIYIPDFYDQIDFECVLTNINLKRLDKNEYILDKGERQRILNILQRSINVEKGIENILDPRLLVKDGVDLSILGEEKILNEYDSEETEDEDIVEQDKVLDKSKKGKRRTEDKKKTKDKNDEQDSKDKLNSRKIFAKLTSEIDPIPSTSTSPAPTTVKRKLKSELIDDKLIIKKGKVGRPRKKPIDENSSIKANNEETKLKSNKIDLEDKTEKLNSRRTTRSSKTVSPIKLKASPSTGDKNKKFLPKNIKRLGIDSVVKKLRSKARTTYPAKNISPPLDEVKTSTVLTSPILASTLTKNNLQTQDKQTRSAHSASQSPITKKQKKKSGKITSRKQSASSSASTSSVTSSCSSSSRLANGGDKQTNKNDTNINNINLTGSRLSELNKRGKSHSSQLEPKSYVTFYEKDPFFDNNDHINHSPFISSIVESRLLIKAVINKDYDLLERLISNENICTFCVNRSVVIQRDALSYAFELNDLQAINMLMNKKYGDKFASFPDVVLVDNKSPLSSSIVSSANSTLFTLTNKCGRSQREIINSLLLDINTDYYYYCPRQKVNLSDDLLVEMIKYNLSFNYIENLIKNEIKNDQNNEKLKESINNRLFNKIPLSLHYGHRELSAKLIDKALKAGGLGFNHLHYEVLVKNTEPLNIFKTLSIRKKALGAAKITPIHCAALNPNPYYISTLLSQTDDLNSLNITPNDYHIQDGDGWQPIHYAAICKSSAPLEYLLSKGIQTSIVDKDGNTPLHLSCFNDSKHNVNVILTHESNAESAINKSNQNNLNDLHIPSSCIEKSNKLGLTPLHIAIEKGSVEIVQILLQSGADAERTTSTASDRLTPLMIAAQYGHMNILKMLIEKGVNIEAKDKRNRSALLHSIINGHSCIVSYLLRLGSNPNIKDTHSNTGAHYAAAYGWYYCMKLLIEAGANLNESNEFNVTPILAAFLKGQMGIVELLTSNLIDINSNFKELNGISLLMRTISSRPGSLMMDRVTYLLNLPSTNVKKVDNNGNNAFHYLVINEFSNNKFWDNIKDDDSENDKEINDDQESLINYEEKRLLRIRHKELRKSHKSSIYEAAKLLIEKGCDLNQTNKDGLTPLNLATKYGSLILLQLFLENDCKLKLTFDDNGNTLLHLIAFNICRDNIDWELTDDQNDLKSGSNVFDVLNLLTKSDESIKVLKEMAAKTNCFQLTPLLFALSNYRKEYNNTIKEKKFCELIKFLIEKLDSNVETKLHKIVSNENKLNDQIYPFDNNDTCFHVAARNCSSNILQLFKGKISNIDCLNDIGKSPLIIALIYDNSEAVKFFLEAGANVNLKVENNSLLLLAAKKCRFSMIPLIVTKIFDVNEFDFESGNTALHYVCMKPENKSCLEALKSLILKGANLNAVNKFKQSPLHLITNTRLGYIDENYEIEEYLLNNGALINLTDDFGCTPLHYVFCKQNRQDDNSHFDPVELVNVLIKGTSTNQNLNIKNGNENVVNLADNLKNTILHKAALRGSSVSCIYLNSKIDNIDSVNNDGNTPLGLSVLNNHENCALVLLQKGANINLPIFYTNERSMKIESTIIEEVIKKNWQGVLYLILDQLENLGRGVYSAVYGSLKIGRLKLAYKLLKRYRVNSPNSSLSNSFEVSQSKSLFHILAQYKLNSIEMDKDINHLFIDIVNLLIEKKFSVSALDENKSSPIIYAAINGNHCLCKELTNIVGVINVAQFESDKFHRTSFSSLFWSINNDDFHPKLKEWCSLLLMNGSNINQLTNYPIYEYTHNDVSFIDLTKTNLNVLQTERFYTPLIISILKRNYVLVKYLLQNKVDINCADSFGRTPIMHAVRMNDLKMVKLLLNSRYDPDKDPKPWNSRFLTFKQTSNAQINTKDCNGWTVVHHLITPEPNKCHDNSDVILRLLARVGASLNLPDKKGLRPKQIAIDRNLKTIVDTLHELMAVEDLKATSVNCE